MSEEQKEALEILKGLEFEEYDWYVKTDKIEGHANDVVEKVEKALQTILNLIEKQQKEIENLKETLEYTIETLEAKPYTAFTAQGDILWDGLEIAEKLKELLENKDE